MLTETVDALRILNDHPDTTFTVITGEGRFFSSGANVTSRVAALKRGSESSSPRDAAVGSRPTEFKNAGAKKMFFASQFALGMEFVRSMIEHKKVLVLALNGPGVGAGGSWFQGVADIFYAAEGAWLQVTFSQLGLIPETGAAVNWAQSIGVHRANDWLMFGGKATVEELKTMGLVNQIFPKEGFHEKVRAHLKEILKDRSGKSMMEAKRMQNASVRDQRVLALFDAWHSLGERFVDGEPMQRMSAKAAELQSKYMRR